MELTRLKIADLNPHPKNYNRHPDKQVHELQRSLDEFGQIKNVVVSNGLIVCGHGLIDAARQNGDDEIDAVVRDDLTDDQVEKLMIADNILAEGGEPDKDILSELLGKWEVGEIPGATEDWYESMFPGTMGPEYGEDEEDEDHQEDDEIPEKPDPIAKRGDVFTLGEHRLMCGDSTSKEDVAKLMQGEKADMVFTSPPYAQQRDYDTKIGDWDTLMNGVFSNLIVSHDAQIFVNLGLIYKNGEWWTYWDSWLRWMAEAGFARFGWYVWDNGPGLPGAWHGRLAPSFEFVFHFNHEARSPRKTKECKCAGEPFNGAHFRGKDGAAPGSGQTGDPIQDKKIPDSVIRVGRYAARGIEVSHPAVFPVGFPSEFIEAYTQDEEVVYEPFGGSGSTLIACERTSRKCRMMEIDPGYCDIIIARWEKLTGDTAVLEA